MGFDLTVSISMGIDPKTGHSYVYYVNDTFLDKKPYDPEEFKIPEQYRGYIEQRGHQFHQYIKKLPPDCFKLAATDFLQIYPEWEHVKQGLDLYDYDDDEWEWTERNHDEFKEFLEWMAEKSRYICIFELYWSY
jgi:hypothetical protein